MDIEEKYNVSRETMSDLEAFQKLVLEWNNKFNLISKSSEKDIWNRHIVDSLQLVDYINKKDISLYDLGSGAGFPGIVLAVYAKHKLLNWQITLVESIHKKANFLNEVKNKLGLNIDVVNDRIENLKIKKADFITSRALASLEKLFEYSFSFVKKETQLIFPKGVNWRAELEEAQKKWFFTYKNYQSITSQESVILTVNNLRRKTHG